jgi:23S rRNA (cytosine1962-C5)-methyltransferase
MTNKARIIIKDGRHKPIVQQHPWVFSGAIARVEGEPQNGDIVDVRTTDNTFLARGYWNEKSQIQVRILTWRDEPIDVAWWRARLQRAIYARQSAAAYQAQFPTGRRLINAESDFLPGLIVDQYQAWLVLQALTLHIDQHKQQIAELLAELLQPRGIFERSDVEVRGKEGLKRSVGVLWGEEPPALIAFDNGTHKFGVDVRVGHKTGDYLDQRENVALLAHHFGTANASQRMLNLFSYTGKFGLAFGGQVTNVDASMEALTLSETLYQHNQREAEFIQADVFDYLRDISQAKQQYDLIVLDPPKFASNEAQVQKATRGYKDINLHAMRCVRSGGYLWTFSCSGAITRDLFQKVVFGALADSGRQAQIVRWLGASDDHPIALTFPEGEYLKGLVLRVW